jgi:hypothetical protein
MYVHGKIAFHEHDIKTVKKKVGEYKGKDSVFYLEHAGPGNIKRHKAAVKYHGKKNQKTDNVAPGIIPAGNGIGHHRRDKEA